MRFEILLAPEAIDDLRSLDPPMQTRVRRGIELHLRHEPTKLSKSRIKRLRGMDRPQYRLRMGDVRVFYDVMAGEVHVLAIVTKSQAAHWLGKLGESEK